MLVLAHPSVLLLLPLPFLVRRFLPERREFRRALRAPFFDQYAELAGGETGSGEMVPRQGLAHLTHAWLGWLLVLGALTRPQWVEPPLTKIVPTRDIMLAVDLSASMETEDFTNAEGRRVDRLTAVKEVVDEFLRRREGDRVGLIFFGSAAFVQAPFTQDLEACRALLDEAQVRMAGPQTVVGDAIGLAITLFRRSDIEERVLILLTDGNDTGSKVPPVHAAEIARDYGITIHTVAVGDPRAAGEEALDEETLRTVAEVTGGGYFRAQDRRELEEVYRRLDRMEAHEIETITHRPRRDLFHWPLGALLLVSLAWYAAAALRPSPWGRRRETGVLGSVEGVNP